MPQYGFTDLTFKGWGASYLYILYVHLVSFAYKLYFLYRPFLYCTQGKSSKLQLSLSTTATLGTEESGYCREVAVVERLKQEWMYGLSAQKMTIVKGKVAVSGGSKVPHFIKTEDFFYSQCVSQVFVLCYSYYDVIVMELFRHFPRGSKTPPHTHTHTHTLYWGSPIGFFSPVIQT